MEASPCWNTSRELAVATPKAKHNTARLNFIFLVANKVKLK